MDLRRQMCTRTRDSIEESQDAPRANHRDSLLIPAADSSDHAPHGEPQMTHSIVFSSEVVLYMLEPIAKTELLVYLLALAAHLDLIPFGFVRQFLSEPRSDFVVHIPR